MTGIRTLIPNPQSASRRPRGFAARMIGNAASATANKSRKFLEHNRRSFTARMLAGLRQYGNFNLPPRAEMNKVIAALAREAGFTVEPDGSTYRSAAPSNVLLKSLNIDAVVNCWWGIVERMEDQKYKWSGYRELFDIIRDMGLKLQVVMAFNAYGGNDFNVDISLPQWVLKIGKENPEIFFTDRVGRWNTECLSWGIDKERILEHRTGREVCYEFMRSFRAEFNDLFTEGLISAVEIGLGASGESKYPSFSERNGWRFPGIGEFQCYDKFLLSSLKDAVKKRGQPSWEMGPDNVGCYNSRPHETRFFREQGSSYSWSQRSRGL